MLKKIPILLFLFLGIISCRKERMEAIGIDNSLHRLVGLSTDEYKGVYLVVEDYANNEKGIRYDSVGIGISSKLVYTGGALNNFGIINSAHALTLSKVFDKISEIQVTSTKDYNEEYVRGVNLLSILSARSTEGSYYYSKNKMPVMDLFKELDYEDYLLSFNVPPSNNEQHIFTITINTTDGKTFSTTTEEVFLRKK